MTYGLQIYEQYECDESRNRPPISLKYNAAMMYADLYNIRSTHLYTAHVPGVAHLQLDDGGMAHNGMTKLRDEPN